MFRYLINRYTMGVLVIVIGVLAAMHFTSFDRPDLTIAEKVIKDVVAPLQSGAMRVSEGVSENFTALLSFRTIKKENMDLKKKLASLQDENGRLKEYEYQNLRLRELLDFKDATANQYQLIAASVVGRTPSNWFSVLTINRGSSDGIKKDMAVVTGEGLVGRVINVSGNYSDVMLILDNDSAVGALVQVNRTEGVVEGMPDNTGYVRMIHVPKDAPLRENQVVVSSGLGGVFPKGIPIGRVEKIQTNSDGLVKTAVIRPFVDFDRIEEVFVIKTIYPPVTSAAPNTGGGQ